MNKVAHSPPLLLQLSHSQLGSATGVIDRGFTGHKENRGIGLTYMNARYYVSSIGRFASADTIIPDPGSSQAYNRYAYVSNNPIRFTDPSGHCAQIKVGYDDEPIYERDLNDQACWDQYDKRVASGEFNDDWIGPHYKYNEEYALRKLRIQERSLKALLEGGIATGPKAFGAYLKSVGSIGASRTVMGYGVVMDVGRESHEVFKELGETQIELDAGKYNLSQASISNASTWGELAYTGGSNTGFVLLAPIGAAIPITETVLEAYTGTDPSHVAGNLVGIGYALVVNPKAPPSPGSFGTTDAQTIAWEATKAQDWNLWTAFKKRILHRDS